MKIRSFTAQTANAAMTLVREIMGPDAVIIAFDPSANGRGVTVRAALDLAVDHGRTPPAPSNSSVEANSSVEERLDAFVKAHLRTVGPTTSVAA